MRAWQTGAPAPRRQDENWQTNETPADATPAPPVEPQMERPGKEERTANARDSAGMD